MNTEAARAFRIVDDESAPRGAHFLVEVLADGPFFEGHFPERPVLPAVAQLVLVDLLRRRIDPHAPPADSIEVLQFLRPIAPGQRIRVRIESPTSGELRFEIECDAGPVTRGRLRLARAGA